MSSREEVICNRPHHTERPCQVHEGKSPGTPLSLGSWEAACAGECCPYVGNYTLLTFKHCYFGLIALLSSLGPAPHQAVSRCCELLNPEESWAFSLVLIWMDTLKCEWDGRNVWFCLMSAGAVFLPQPPWGYELFTRNNEKTGPQ